MVLVSRKNKKLILEYLFKEGVLAVKKDGGAASGPFNHADIPVPNLHVMMVMKSLASKDYVKFKFNWRWFYYFLTDKGIEYALLHYSLLTTYLFVIHASFLCD